MKRVLQLLLLTTISAVLSCAAPQDQEKSKPAPDRARCSFAEVMNGKACKCPMFSTQSPGGRARYDIQQTLEGRFTSKSASDVAVALRGCGDPDAFVLFDESGQSVAYVPFDLASCATVKATGAVDQIACLDTVAPSGSGAEFTHVRLLDFEKRGGTNHDRVLHRFVDRTSACPSGAVTVRKGFALNGGVEPIQLEFLSATVDVPAGQNYCEWQGANEIRFTRETIAIRLPEDDPQQAPRVEKREPEPGEKAVRNVIISNISQIQHCYEEVLRETQIGGKLRVRFEVSEEGSANGLRMESEELSVGFRHCVVNQLRRFDYGDLPQAVTVSSRFVFELSK